MNVLIVMDRNGDSRFEFDAEDAKSVKAAKARFDELTKQGYRPVALGKDGGGSGGTSNGKLMRTFDATVERTLFIPQLEGG
jgi:hypothetical protein